MLRRVAVLTALALVASACGTRLDYRREPLPPLASDEAAWADRLLQDAGLR